MSQQLKVILIIAGSDSCGGAGVQADIKTAHRLGAYPITAISAITSQNSKAIYDIYKIPARVLETQIEAVLEEFRPDSVKIGMIYSVENAKALKNILRRYNLKNVVLDPVIISSTGVSLMEEGVIQIIKEELLSMVSIVTPNIYEAEIISETKIEGVEDMEMAAKIIKDMGPDVVITGGHLRGDLCLDIFFDGEKIHRFEHGKIASDATHGTGCVFSTALATHIAMGYKKEEAVKLSGDLTVSSIHRGYGSVVLP